MSNNHHDEKPEIPDDESIGVSMQIRGAAMIVDLRALKKNCLALASELARLVVNGGEEIEDESKVTEAIFQECQRFIGSSAVRVSFQFLPPPEQPKGPRIALPGPGPRIPLR